MRQPRVPLTPAKMKRLLQLLDDARTMERITQGIENEANDLLGGGFMDWVLDYTANTPDVPFGAWCERAGVGYKRYAPRKRSRSPLRRQRTRGER